MADSYTQFSEQIPDLSDEAVAWCREVLYLDDDVEEDLPKLLDALNLEDGVVDMDSWPGFEWEIKDDNTLWLHSDDYADFEHISVFVEALIKKFMPDYIFTLTAAGTCSRPRIKEFGGTWMVISKEGTQWGSTWDDAEREEAKLRTKDLLPYPVDIGFGETLHIEKVPLEALDGNLGSYDQRTGVMQIGEQPKAGQLIVLIHEALHAIEVGAIHAGIIDDEIIEKHHDYLAMAANGIASILAKLELIPSVTYEEIMDVMATMAEECDET